METEASQDDQHLRLLGIFHYIVGAMGALFSLFPLIHVILGVFLLLAPVSQHPEAAPPAFFAWLFIAIGGALFLMGEVTALCIITAGAFIHRRLHYWFVFIVACLECMFVPFGTILGVFTIIVLSKPAVKQQFGVAR